MLKSFAKAVIRYVSLVLKSEIYIKVSIKIDCVKYE
jgi:hypothetical protein